MNQTVQEYLIANDKINGYEKINLLPLSIDNDAFAEL